MTGGNGGRGARHETERGFRLPVTPDVPAPESSLPLNGRRETSF